MAENFSDRNLSSDEIEARAGSYYRNTLEALTDYSLHCNRVRVNISSHSDAYQREQTNILEVLGFTLGFSRVSVLADISKALAGGETDD